MPSFIFLNSDYPRGGGRDYWIRLASVPPYGRPISYRITEGRQPSRKAARAAYAAQGKVGRIVLERPRMKKRGAKFKPAPPVKCLDCRDTGTYMVGNAGAWDGYDEVECECVARPADSFTPAPF